MKMRFRKKKILQTVVIVSDDFKVLGSSLKILGAATESALPPLSLVLSATNC